MSVPPILQFDATPQAIIEPTSWHPRIPGLPSAGVMTWMPDAFERLLDEHPSTVRHRFQAETADAVYWQVDLDVGPVIATLSPVGAAAAALTLETLIAIGCRRVVSIGSSGGLLRDHPPGTVVVPDQAIRDEGLSYHYAPPETAARPNPMMQNALRSTLAAAGHQPIGGKVWTTDALYRETDSRVARRVSEGAVAVDMELSALATVAAFRGIPIGSGVYVADTLHGDVWDPSELIDRDTDFRYLLLLAAARTSVTATL